MAKTTAPLLSFDASGGIADTMVFSRWRGIPYVRRHVIPANPRSTAQTLTRDIFRTLNSMWLNASSELIAPWDAFATGRPFVGRNAFIGQNITLLRDDPPLTTMETFRGSPGAKGGLAPEAMVLTPGAGTIDAALTVPATPSGWTLTQSVGVAFPDQDPSAVWSGSFVTETTLATPWTLNFSGLEATTDYVVSAWLQWEKPNGDVAYSVSLTDIATTT